ncbi:hypothetical protein ACQEVF_32655 [Nonomuraea polychroma]|uniref:hypothetical protein n=1 Tax=Nonomuraea polychroma TaxID=46176 RepID=UPI003D91E84B
MPDLTAYAALTLLILGTAVLTWAITRSYYQNQYGTIADALDRLLKAADDEDARDLDSALAHADAVLERWPT